MIRWLIKDLAAFVALALFCSAVIAWAAIFAGHPV